MSSREPEHIPFRLESPFQPTGDQPKAIAELLKGLDEKRRYQTLLGITGSGKTFTMANVIEKIQKPTLIIAPNKILAAQLHSEFKALFPHNAVHYFVSYYDYYQPEAYVPASDTFIEKDSLVNEEIDRMRHAATFALLSRTDVIIVASVSCIYGIGAPEAYLSMVLDLEVGEEVSRDVVLRRLVELHYERNEVDFSRGRFRVRGDVVEVFPAYEHDTALRIEWWGDEIESITEVDPLRGLLKTKRQHVSIFPASHYVTPQHLLSKAITSIKEELHVRLNELADQMKLVEKQRLGQRTLFDMEMLEQMGFCNGIENYSRYLSGRAAGQPPPTLIDYFPQDYLLVVDESHQTVPQIGGMYKGDRSRKETLVEYGFRLPSALDNRPLKFDEWVERAKKVVFVSATPGNWELEQCHGVVVEQVIRPTGLLDPEIEVRPVKNQVDDLLDEIRERVKKKERVLVTTLTKRMAEDLTEYYGEIGVKVRYLHSDVETLERIAIIRDLRLGVFDVLVGINLLREGLDLPEVSLVGILDADKEGFLRAERSLIQTCGRAARHLNGRVFMYGDRVTKSMKVAIDETNRRRTIQAAYNKEHGITPKSATRTIHDLGATNVKAGSGVGGPVVSADISLKSPGELRDIIADIKKQMHAAADDMNFERAAELRDKLMELQAFELAIA